MGGSLVGLTRIGKCINAVDFHAYRPRIKQACEYRKLSAT